MAEQVPSLDTDLKMVDVFGFDERALVDAVVERARAASRSYLDGNFLANASGTIRYFHTVSALREAFTHLGYRAENGDLVELAVNPGRGVAIASAAGDVFTGVPRGEVGVDASTKWPKGARTALKISRNNAQTELFTLPGGSDPALPIYTWMLLQHADEKEVRSELSLPREMSRTGYVTSWYRRFLLPALPNVGGPTFGLDDDGPDDIDVPVNLR